MMTGCIKAWASALPSDSNRQCEKPLKAGRATSADSHAVFLLSYLLRVEVYKIANLSCG